MRAAVVLFGTGLWVLALSAQEAARPSDPSLVFDVVSIKLNKSGSGAMTIGYPPGNRFTMVNGPIASMVRSAYPSDTSELSGAPSWLESDRYDVTALAGRVSSTDELREMLKTLLADRLRFVGHYETQERPVYALVLARPDRGLGPDIRKSDVDCEAIYAAQRAGKPMEVAPPSNGAPACGMSAGGGVLRVGGMSLAPLMGNIRGAAGRVVVDKTGLVGNYEYTLRWDARPPGSPPADDRPSVFTALQEQLGLRLEPDRAPLRVLVIDRIERPTED
jgi:uncharacterized protein (TIGR03435 family)